MEKILHERLRDGIAEADDTGVAECRFCDARGAHFIGIEFAKTIADEIERYYIPLPCDESGEPWKIGDPVEYPADCKGDTRGKVYGFKFCDRWYLLIESVTGYHIEEFAVDCSRPTPKILDADGVPCKKGETIFDIHNGTKLLIMYLTDDRRILCRYGDGLVGHYLASEVTHEKPVFDADGERICKGDTVWNVSGKSYAWKVEKIDGAGAVFCYSDYDKKTIPFDGDRLTHREPDSLEKLRDDMQKAGLTFDVASAHIGKPCNATEWAKRLTALIERGA